MDASFEVSNHRSDCCEFIDLAGELDMDTAPHLEAVLDRIAPTPDHIVVDVSRLAFMDSSGLRVLLRASHLVEGRIWLKGCSAQIMRLLDISGVLSSFCLEDDAHVAHEVMAGL